MKSSVCSYYSFNDLAAARITKKIQREQGSNDNMTTIRVHSRAEERD